MIAMSDIYRRWQEMDYLRSIMEHLRRLLDCQNPAMQQYGQERSPSAFASVMCIMQDVEDLRSQWARVQTLPVIFDRDAYARRIAALLAEAENVLAQHSRIIPH